MIFETLDGILLKWIRNIKDIWKVNVKIDKEEYRLLQLTLDEMNMLSDRLEEEEARLHQQYTQRPDRSETTQRLYMISQLQQKLRDLKADITNEEKEMLSGLLQEEIEHIHGHSPRVYESILNKLHQ